MAINVKGFKDSLLRSYIKPRKKLTTKLKNY